MAEPCDVSTVIVRPIGDPSDHCSPCAAEHVFRGSNRGRSPTAARTGPVDGSVTDSAAEQDVAYATDQAVSCPGDAVNDIEDIVHQPSVLAAAILRLLLVRPICGGGRVSSPSLIVRGGLHTVWHRRSRRRGGRICRCGGGSGCGWGIRRVRFGPAGAGVVAHTVLQRLRLRECGGGQPRACGLVRSGRLDVRHRIVLRVGAGTPLDGLVVADRRLEGEGNGARHAQGGCCRERRATCTLHRGGSPVSAHLAHISQVMSLAKAHQ